MARGQRRSAQDQIKEIDEKINKHKKAIKVLEEKRTVLIKTQTEEEKNMLFAYLQTNNISISEAMNMLQK